MLESAWLFTGVTAVLVTTVAVLTQTQGAALIPNDDGVAIISGVLGFISWGVFAFGALDVRVVGDSVTYSFGMPSIAIFATIMGLVPGYVALTGPAEIIASRYRNPSTDEL